MGFWTVGERAAARPELSLLQVLRRATGYLQGHGSGSPRLDAELLLAEALGLRRLDLYLQFERILEEPELARFRDLVGRRGRGEPVAYLLGRREFMGLEFEVTPAVLVPNPDTELLVQRAVGWARDRARPVRAADVGTGSGCVAVALAHFAPQVEVVATDLYPEALQVAARNVDRHGLGRRIRLLAGDLVEPLPSGLDLICANLPYLDESACLPAEVLAQPASALFAREGGAALVGRLLRESPGRLAAGGAVLAEVDPGVVAALDLSAYAGHTMHRDLGGRVRLVEAWL